MTSAQKVLEVERQVRAMLDGSQEPIFTCPFCTLPSQIGQFLCCNEAAAVINATLDHIDHLERCTVIDRTMDRMADINAAQSASVLVN